MTSPLGLAKTKQREFFFVSPFVLLLVYAYTISYAYAYAYAYDDPYVAGLTSFLCFALMLMLYCVNHEALGYNSPHLSAITSRKMCLEQ